MNALTRYQNRLNSQRRTVPTLFDFFSQPLSEFKWLDPFDNHQENNFKIDLQDKGDHYLLKADLPGVKKEDIQLNYDNGYLTIRAEHHSDKEHQDEHGFIFKERSQGVYERMFALEDVDANQINAAFANGELDINLKKKASTEQKTTITIH